MFLTKTQSWEGESINKLIEIIQKEQKIKKVDTEKTKSRDTGRVETVKELKKYVDKIEEMPDRIKHENLEGKSDSIKNNMLMSDTYPITVKRDSPVGNSYTMRYGATGVTDGDYWLEATSAKIPEVIDDGPFYDVSVDSVEYLVVSVEDPGTSDSVLRKDFEYEVAFYALWEGFRIRIGGQSSEGFTQFGTNYIE